MTKSGLIDKVAEDMDFTKTEAKVIIESVFKNITDCLVQGGAFKLIGFGTFGIRKRAAREGRNPGTGQSVSIPAKNVPFFKAGKILKKNVE